MKNCAAQDSPIYSLTTFGLAVVFIIVSQAAGGPPTSAGGWMYWADRDFNVIKRAHLDGSNVEILFDGTDAVVTPRGVALYPEISKVYWTQGEGPYKVCRGNMDGTGSAETLVAHCCQLVHIALDPQGGRLHCAGLNQPADLMLSADLEDGSDVQVWSTGATTTGAISIDTETRKLYWAVLPNLSCANEGKIQRADLDDLTAIEDVVNGIKRVRSLFIDTTNGTIYWSESCSGDKIRSVDLTEASLPIDGNPAEVLVPNELALGVVVDASTGKLYWTQNTDVPVMIRRANAADGTSVQDIVTTGLAAPFGITLYPGNPADLNGDGAINGIDLAILLGAWGACPKRGSCAADLSHDAIVNGFDLAMLLGSWGT